MEEERETPYPFSSSSTTLKANSTVLGTGNSPDSYLAICGRLLPNRLASSS